MNYITTFEQLVILTKGLSNLFFKECFISDLKEAIQAHIMMQHPKTWLEACDRAKEANIVINAQAKRHLFNTLLIPLW
jgi:pentose-5-phosphate-3-epimerase